MMEYSAIPKATQEALDEGVLYDSLGNVPLVGVRVFRANFLECK